MANLVLVSPLAGWSAPLTEVPDPVFAERMLGDGVAIDPTSGTLYAPCDGTILAVPASRHAVTLRAGSAEILLHVGIDTVALAGEGFKLHTAPGRDVRAGEPLLTFDLDLAAQRAKSLLSPILVLKECGYVIVRRRENGPVAVGDVLMELAPASAAGLTRAPIEGQQSVTRPMVIRLPHGIHARPAALLANSIRHLGADVVVTFHGREANARSTIALMALGVQHGEQVEVRASGAEAAAAVSALESTLRAIESSEAPPQEPAASVATLRSREPEPEQGKTLRGVVASRGLAVGVAVPLSRVQIEVTEEGRGVAFESAALDLAREAVKKRLERGARTAGAGEPERATRREILAAHLALLDDPTLVQGARALIAQGRSAAYGWRVVIRDSMAALGALGHGRLAERADDLLDLESQVLTELQAAARKSGDRSEPAADPLVGGALPARAILIARELLPSQLVALDPARIAGLCTLSGGPTSHVSILASALGIPALVGVDPALLAVPAGVALILDAEKGELHVDPEPARIAAVERGLADREATRRTRMEAAQARCRTADGVRIEVLANLGSLADAQAAVRLGAEGCGLLRTEFLFLDRETPPDELEQATHYQRIADVLGTRPLTLRTLDAGGDKPIPYLPLPHEDNPALGLRGVRVSLWRPELLRVQLRAVLRMRSAGRRRIMLPMVTDAAEIRAVRALLREESQAIERSADIELGVMVETPAAAVMADRMAAEADFLSIGTNDLTQYALAMDRGHAELASRLDALHPAVLGLIARTVAAARAHGRPVAVCGGLASDLEAVPILIGLGVHELSAVPSIIPDLKALVAQLSVEECKRIAERALGADSAAGVRAAAARARRDRQCVATPGR